MRAVKHVGIIGFGEVGSIFARDLIAKGVAKISVWDIAFADASSFQLHHAEMTERVHVCVSGPEAVVDVDVVFVCVTANSVLDALSSMGELKHAPFVVDVNSVAPSTKRAAGEIIRMSGGRYVEAAVMSNVPTQGLGTPMLLGGPSAEAFAEMVAPFQMNLTIFSKQIGPASSVKMCRSVMVKGLEALATECLLAARRYGVDGEVLHSLSDVLPNENWHCLAAYLISRSILHGRRRAEEMEEVAKTLEDVGIEGALSYAIAARQYQTFELGRRVLAQDKVSSELEPLLDELLQRLPRPESGSVAPFPENSV